MISAQLPVSICEQTHMQFHRFFMNSSYLQYIIDDVEGYMWSKSEEFLCSQEDTALDSRFDVGAGRERIKTRLRRWWLFLYCCRIIGRLCTPTAIV